jgi:hypothetical protein
MIFPPRKIEIVNEISTVELPSNGKIVGVTGLR